MVFFIEHQLMATIFIPTRGYLNRFQYHVNGSLKNFDNKITHNGMNAISIFIHGKLIAFRDHFSGSLKSNIITWLQSQLLFIGV